MFLLSGTGTTIPLIASYDRPDGESRFFPPGSDVVVDSGFGPGMVFNFPHPYSIVSYTTAVVFGNTGCTFYIWGISLLIILGVTVLLFVL